MLLYALTGGVIGHTSILVGFVHLREWRNDSLAGASTMAIISWAITALAFGYVLSASLWTKLSLNTRIGLGSPETLRVGFTSFEI